MASIIRPDRIERWISGTTETRMSVLKNQIRHLQQQESYLRIICTLIRHTNFVDYWQNPKIPWKFGQWISRKLRLSPSNHGAANRSGLRYVELTGNRGKYSIFKCAWTPYRFRMVARERLCFAIRWGSSLQTRKPVFWTWAHLKFALCVFDGQMLDATHGTSSEILVNWTQWIRTSSASDIFPIVFEFYSSVIEYPLESWATRYGISSCSSVQIRLFKSWRLLRLPLPKSSLNTGVRNENHFVVLLFKAPVAECLLDQGQILFFLHFFRAERNLDVDILILKTLHWRSSYWLTHDSGTALIAFHIIINELRIGETRSSRNYTGARRRRAGYREPLFKRAAAVEFSFVEGTSTEYHRFSNNFAPWVKTEIVFPAGKTFRETEPRHRRLGRE